jgi:hypothetical protein
LLYYSDVTNALVQQGVAVDSPTMPAPTMTTRG